ncbi:LNS2 domain-containing protein [Alteromonas australica]|uniref:LNS2 domain-containing protein n=1 Tax=Alteromonas australica TaxID=589873 RepID=UPI003BB95E19
MYSERENTFELVQSYANNRFKINYLTVRNSYFRFNRQIHLFGYNFPERGIQVANSMAERKNFKTFKLNILKRYTESGWRFFVAYGDSSTGFAAHMVLKTKYFP